MPVYTFLSGLPALLAVSGFVIYQLLRHKLSGDKLLSNVAAKLRKAVSSSLVESRKLSPSQLERRITRDQRIREQVNRQDFQLLQQLLRHQFHRSVFVYGLVALLFVFSVWMYTHPPQDKTSQDKHIAIPLMVGDNFRMSAVGEPEAEDKKGFGYFVALENNSTEPAWIKEAVLEGSLDIRILGFGTFRDSTSFDVTLDWGTQTQKTDSTRLDSLSGRYKAGNSTWLYHTTGEFLRSVDSKEMREHYSYRILIPMSTTRIDSGSTLVKIFLRGDSLAIRHAGIAPPMSKSGLRQESNTITFRLENGDSISHQISRRFMSALRCWAKYEPC